MHPAAGGADAADTSPAGQRNGEQAPERAVVYKPNQCHASTQTDITVSPDCGAPSKKTSDQLVANNGNKSKKKLITTNPCSGNCKSFGYESLKKERHVVDIAGVTCNVFALLLSKMPALPKNSHPKFDAKNKLLICLMKLRLGLTYAAMGAIFSCSASTISRNFKDTLDIIYNQTYNYVFWPDKFSIQSLSNIILTILTRYYTVLLCIILMRKFCYT